MEERGENGGKLVAGRRAVRGAVGRGFERRAVRKRVATATSGGSGDGDGDGDGDGGGGGDAVGEREDAGMRRGRVEGAKRKGRRLVRSHEREEVYERREMGGGKREMQRIEGQGGEEEKGEGREGAREVVEDRIESGGSRDERGRRESGEVTVYRVPGGDKNGAAVKRRSDGGGADESNGPARQKRPRPCTVS